MSREGQLAKALKQRKPPRTTSPTVVALMGAIDQSGALVKEVAEDAGYSRTSIEQWRRGHCRPSIIAVESLAQALGYRIALIKISSDKSDLSD